MFSTVFPMIMCFWEHVASFSFLANQQLTFLCLLSKLSTKTWILYFTNKRFVFFSFGKSSYSPVWSAVWVTVQTDVSSMMHIVSDTSPASAELWVIQMSWLDCQKHQYFCTISAFEGIQRSKTKKLQSGTHDMWPQLPGQLRLSHLTHEWDRCWCNYWTHNKAKHLQYPNAIYSVICKGKCAAHWSLWLNRGWQVDSEPDMRPDGADFAVMACTLYICVFIAQLFTETFIICYELN